MLSQKRIENIKRRLAETYEELIVTTVDELTFKIYDRGDKHEFHVTRASGKEGEYKGPEVRVIHRVEKEPVIETILTNDVRD